MADNEIRLTLNLGPRASIQTVSSAINDLALVLDFASALQRRVERDAVLSARLRNRGVEESNWFVIEGLSPIRPVPDEFERFAIRQADENSRITVQSLRYENPLELVILAGGAVIISIVRMLRDWPDRRRLNHAVASEYENRVAFRERVRERVLQKIDDGTLPITQETMEALLTDDVTDALGTLGDGPLEVSLPNANTTTQE
jgi:hypothetical protein